MKKLIWICVVLLLTGLAGYKYLMPDPVTTNPPATTPEGETKKYTLAEIAKHDNPESCWMAIEGSVYDVTPFVASGFHPGRDKILLGCGKDATAIFNQRPGKGTAHSERARTMLPKYLIGELEG